MSDTRDTTGQRSTEMMRHGGSTIVLIALVSSSAAGQGATGGRIDFARGWRLAGEQTRVDTVDGTTVLGVRTGGAVFPAGQLENGTVEFDVQVTRHRSFVYFNFRMQNEAEYEELYFRPQKSGLPDAIQYSPVYQGVSNWQLYHGAGYTAPAWLPPNEWIHVRVVLDRSRLAVFVGNVSQPQLVVSRLGRDPASGYFAFGANLVDPRAPADMPAARFRNLVVRPGDVGFTFPAVAERPTPAGFITEWQVSRPFVPDSGAIERLPPDVVARPGWRTLRTDHRGVLVLFRDVKRPNEAERPAVLARLAIVADRARTVRLDLGYSDEASVFLNGQLLFVGNLRYSFDQPRRDGVITLGQQMLSLPLRAGRNELTLAVSDVFGGWGVMGRIPDMTGLRVLAGGEP